MVFGDLDFPRRSGLPKHRNIVNYFIFCHLQHCCKPVSRKHTDCREFPTKAHLLFFFILLDTESRTDGSSYRLALTDGRRGFAYPDDRSAN